MKKYRVLLLTLVVSILMFFSAPINSFATNAVDDKTEKEHFAELCNSIFHERYAYTTNKLNTNSYEDIYDGVLKYIANDITAISKLIQSDTLRAKTDTSITEKEFEEYLNSKGLFIYSKEEENNIMPCSSGSTDVRMSSVLILYNSPTQEWIVTGGGNWTSSTYGGDIPSDPLPYVGKRTNIGGQDAVGVTLYGTSGDKPTLKRSSGYIHDGQGSNMTLKNPCNLDSTRGVAFEYQDYKTVTKLNTWDHEYTYMGHGFSAQAIYNKTFEKYHGKARSYYAHTWSNTNITSISVSSSGFSTSWSHSTNRWAIYNNSEQTF